MKTDPSPDKDPLPPGYCEIDVNPPLNLENVRNRLEKMGLLVKSDELPDNEGATPD